MGAGVSWVMYSYGVRAVGGRHWEFIFLFLFSSASLRKELSSCSHQNEKEVFIHKVHQKKNSLDQNMHSKCVIDF
jgi:hypothetical protein